MVSQTINSKTVALLATNGFEQSELVRPKQALEDAGARTVIVSPESGSIKGWNEKNWGDSFSVDMTLDQADASRFDALVLPGGVMNPDSLRTNQKAIAFIRSFFDQNKPVAAICHGPWTLIEAGVVDGRRMTSFKSIQTDLKNAGAKWVDQEVVTDGNLITSRKPDDLDAFNSAIIEMLGQMQPAMA